MLECALSAEQIDHLLRLRTRRNYLRVLDECEKKKHDLSLSSDIIDSS